MILVKYLTILGDKIRQKTLLLYRTKEVRLMIETASTISFLNEKIAKKLLKN